MSFIHSCSSFSRPCWHHDFCLYWIGWKVLILQLGQIDKDMSSTLPQNKEEITCTVELNLWQLVHYILWCGCMCAAQVKSTQTPPSRPHTLSNIIKWRPYLSGVLMAKSQERMPFPYFPLCLDKCILHVIQLVCKSCQAREWREVGYMWNVKCSVSENIKECSEPRGACKINDPDWLLHKTKSGENSLLYEKGHSSSSCVFYNLWTMMFHLFKKGHALHPGCGLGRIWAPAKKMESLISYCLTKRTIKGHVANPFNRIIYLISSAFRRHILVYIVFQPFFCRSRYNNKILPLEDNIFEWLGVTLICYFKTLSLLYFI